MDIEKWKMYSSFTLHVDEQTKPNGLKNLLNNIEDKLRKSKMLRKRIDDMHLNSSYINSSHELPEHHNDVILAINSKCNLLLSDMEENYDINIKETMKLIKEYAEDIAGSYDGNLKNNLKVSRPENMSKLNLNEYAENLNMLNDRLIRYNLNKINYSECERNPEVEEKFTRLSEELHLFTKVISISLTFHI